MIGAGVGKGVAGAGVRVKDGGRVCVAGGMTVLVEGGGAVLVAVEGFGVRVINCSRIAAVAAGTDVPVAIGIGK